MHKRLNFYFRLLHHSGVYPDYTEEPSDLAAGRANVKNVTLLISDWFESGVLHAKVWISDSRDVYIGSANNDWKSLTQVISSQCFYFWDVTLRVCTGLYLLDS